MTQADAAQVFDMGFLEEEEDAQGPGSPNAIHQLEAQLRDMDAYQQQQDAFVCFSYFKELTVYRITIL